MDDKIMEYPCTKKCLVFASCSITCMEYVNYVQDACQSKKYGCFKIIPEPPQNIRELAEIVNRVEGDKYVFSYYTSADIVIISYKSPPKMYSAISNIRKIETLKYHPHFPEDFR